jgi:hypothetical protein
MFRSVDKINTHYSGFQRFIILILFPPFDVKHISDYNKGALYQILNCGKDVFYRFVNSPDFPWRKYACQISLRPIKRTQRTSDNTDNKEVKCLIVDDTDLPKRGRCFELLSRIYSHVTNSFNCGFKGLFPGCHDGTGFLGLDFSLHGEKGDPEKANYKPCGLTENQTKARYSKNRQKESAGKQRENEYFKSKTEMLMEMDKTAVLQGIRFDCLPADSWFCNAELVKFIATRRIKCQFPGMLKRETTKYLFRGKQMNFNEILKFLQRTKMQRCRKLKPVFMQQPLISKALPLKFSFADRAKMAFGTVF